VSTKKLMQTNQSQFNGIERHKSVTSEVKLSTMRPQATQIISSSIHTEGNNAEAPLCTANFTYHYQSTETQLIVYHLTKPHLTKMVQNAPQTQMGKNVKARNSHKLEKFDEIKR